MSLSITSMVCFLIEASSQQEDYQLPEASGPRFADREMRSNAHPKLFDKRLDRRGGAMNCCHEEPH